MCIRDRKDMQDQGFLDIAENENVVEMTTARVLADYPDSEEDAFIRGKYLVDLANYSAYLSAIGKNKAANLVINVMKRYLKEGGGLKGYIASLDPSNHTAIQDPEGSVAAGAILVIAALSSKNFVSAVNRALKQATEEGYTKEASLAASILNNWFDMYIPSVKY